MNLIFIGSLFGIIELTISLRLNSISLRRNFKLASSFAKPSRIENTANYIESKLKSIELKSLRENNTRKRVAIIGGGLSGLSCAKYLIDAGHIPIGNSYI
jgi:heterodisulfide reductase subunit A-like polyferredoxin